MANAYKQLAQDRPSGTTAVTLYTVPASTTTLFKSLFIVNNSASSAKYSIYHDDAGSTYDQATTLGYQVDIGANSFVLIDTLFASDASSTGTIGVQTDTSNALTFTLYGDEVT